MPGRSARILAMPNASVHRAGGAAGEFFLDARLLLQFSSSCGCKSHWYFAFACAATSCSVLRPFSVLILK